MSVGSKLAGLIFGVAVLIVIILLFLSSSLLQIFDIDPIFELDLKIEVTSLISALAVLVLVWERLRESLAKSLESVNQNVLNSFWRRLNHDTNLYRLRKDEIEKTKDYLKRYGRFLGLISIHPLSWERIDRFISLLEQKEKNILQIENLAEKELKKIVDRENILKKLGFEPLWPSQRTPEFEEEYTRVAQKIQSEQRKLIDDTKKLVEDLKEVRKEIYENLDDFLKTNNLSILTHYAAPR